MKPFKYVNEAGTITYKLNEMLHRTDGPAIQSINGIKEWYVNGNRHRLDGPAVEFDPTSLAWPFTDDRYGLTNLTPVSANIYNKWYINGVEYNELEYWIAVQNYNNTHE